MWSSITAAIDASEWFVLLLIEDAAGSEWVNREVEYWVANKDASRILPVVTDGEFFWVDGDVSGSAAPEALSRAFSEEPRWVDSGDVVWSSTPEPGTSDHFVGVHINPNSTLLAVSVEDSQGAVRQTSPDDRPNRVLILDAASGDLVRVLRYPDCTSAQVLGSGWSSDGSLIAVTNGWLACPREAAPEGLWVEVFDGRTFETVAVIESEDPAVTWAFFEPDNDLLVRGLFTGTHRYPAPDFAGSDLEVAVAFGAVSPDGSTMSSVDLADPTRHSLVETETGSRFEGAASAPHGQPLRARSWRPKLEAVSRAL